jgi:serine protease Do
MNDIHVQLKKMWSHELTRTVLVSFLTILVTLGIIFLIAWQYRTAIFQTLAQGYIKEQQKTLAVATPAPVEPIVAKEQAQIIEEKPEPVVQDTVITAVKKAQPAVVSIIVSREVPKYDVTYQDTEIFPGVFMQVPIRTQNGTEKKQVGSGSGFLISRNGLIVTNRHVVTDQNAIFDVFLNNGKTYQAQVLVRDTVNDVAVLKINGTGLPYLIFGDSDTIEVGQSVVAIGNALGEFKNSVSVGVISGLSRSITAGNAFGGSEKLEKVIQTDAAINPGNSGGPLLNLKGEVIGINVAVAQGSENIGFALPINSVKAVINAAR